MAHNTETDKSDQPYNLILLKDTIYEDVQLENDHKLITESFPRGERHTHILFIFLSVVIGFALRVNMSIGIVAMTDKSSANKNFEELQWNESARSTILSSFYWGHLLTQVYAGHMAQKYGGKYFLSGAIGVCSVLTLITPLTATHGGVIGMCINQTIQGMSQGFLFPVINVLLSKWASKSEKTRFSAFVYSGAQFGIMTMLPTAGLIANSAGGWPAIFYISGAVGLVWVLVWSLIGASSPAEHPTISDSEKTFIIGSQNNTLTKKQFPTPWRKILKSMPLWAISVAHITENWGYFILLTSMPTYINYILKFNIKSNGFLSALPYLVMWLITMGFSWISDYIRKYNLMSNTCQRKIWNSIAHWGGALALFSLYLFDTNVIGAIFLLTVALGLNSGVYTGFLTNHMDLAPNFAGTLMGITMSLANIASILGPLLVGFVVTDSDNKDQWGIIFLVSAAVFFFGNLFYIIFGSTKIQPWNDTPEYEIKTIQKD